MFQFENLIGLISHLRLRHRGRTGRAFKSSLRDDSSQYAAFISYNRAQDARLATALQSSLQGFAKPWYLLRSFRVFRDDASLTANPDLWSSVEKALKESEFFILLASPPAANSRWVQREVAYWIEHKSIEKLFVAVTGGMLAVDPQTDEIDRSKTTALPPSLLQRYQRSPRYVDLRWVHEGDPEGQEDRLSLSNPEFLDCIADLGAPLHHRDKRDLIGEEVRQHNRIRLLRRVIITILSVLTLLAGSAAAVAVNQRQSALSRLDLATSRQLASDSKLKITSDPQLAALLALTAFDVQDTPEARGAMLNALQQLPNVDRILSHDVTPVNSIAVSPDGSTLAAGDAAGVVRLWDLRSHTVVAALTSNIHNVLSVAFSPDGHSLAVGGEGKSPFGPGEVALWNLTNRSNFVISGHWYGVKSVAFSPDGKTLAFAGGHKTAPIGPDNPLGMDVILWDISSRTQIAALKGHTNSVLSLAFSLDGKVLTSAGYFEVFVWDVQHHVPFAQPAQSGDAVSISPDGRTLAIAKGATRGAEIILWNTQSQAQSGSIIEDSVEFFKPSSVAFSPDGKTLAVAGQTGLYGIGAARLTVWDVDKRSRIANLTGHTGPINSLTFSPDGNTLVSSGNDGNVILWSMAGENHLRKELVSHAGSVKNVHFSTDGEKLAAVVGDSPTATDATGNIWNVASGKHIAALDQQSGPVLDVALGRDGGVVAEASADGIVIWDANTRVQLAHLGLTPGEVMYLPDENFGFSPDGRTLTEIVNSGIALWHYAEPGRRKVLPHPLGVEASVDWTYSDDGHTIAAGESDSTGKNVFLWDVATDKEIAKLDLAHESIMKAAISPDGRMLAGVALSGKVILWNIANPAPVAILTGHTSEGYSIAFSPDGSLLASSGDKEIILWDVSRRTEIGTLPVQTRGGDVRFSPDGRTLATGGDSLLLWDVDTSSWRTQLCTIVGRNMTIDEWGTYLPERPYQATCSGY